MRNPSIPLFLLLVSCAPADAQAQITGAFRAGASIATLGGSAGGDTGLRTGLSVGGAVTFPLAANLGVQLGAGYVQKGAKETIDGVEVTLALDYVEIPLLLSVALPLEGSISPHFLVGPVASAKAKCQLRGAVGGATTSFDCGPSDVAVKAIDIGAMAGAGLDIRASGALTITLDVFFNAGLTSFDDSANHDDVKNRAWSILGGVSFPLG